MNKYFHGLLFGVSVLPALLVMPAMAYDVTASANLNDLYPDGVITDGIIYSLYDAHSYDLSFTTPTINISNNSGHAVNAWWGSELTFGGSETTSINFSGSGRGLSVFDENTQVSLDATDSIRLSGANNHAFISNGAGIEVEIESGNSIDVSSTNGNGFYVLNDSKLNLHTKNLTVNTSFEDTDGDQNLNVMVGILAGGSNSEITVNADNINILSTGDTQAVAVQGTGDNNKSGHLVLNAKNIVLRSENNGQHESDIATVHSANYTNAGQVTDQSKLALLEIKGDNIDISAPKLALAVMSQGILDIKGNAKITSGKDAIVARGGAQLYINKNTNYTLKMDGDIDFNYDKNSSGTIVDAIVDVTVSGSDSYWTGNTVASYGTGKAPDESYMKVNSIYLTVKNGATWNATKVVDNMNEDTSGSGYVAMNYLTINNGTVNIADTTRGIVVENANVADATFNGGALNIGTMNLTGGTNTFNNNVVGIDNASALNIASGATMNIGTNAVNVKNITLDGTMLATLRDGDAQITAGTFDGNGTLKLSFAGEGTYHVFGDAAFRAAGIEATSSVYDITWAEDNKDMVVSMKSAVDIAEQNGIEQDAAKAIIGLNASTSEKLNDLGLKIQEKLAEDTPEAKREVEHAAKAVHPEKESVTQSVATSVQNTVTNLASARMAAPTFGRSGGDITMTSGGVWAQGLLNKSKQNDAFRGYTRGIAAGLDGTMNKVWTVGAGYSYAHSDISGSARDTEIDSNTVFLYGQYKPAAWYVNAVANYTMSDYTEDGSAMGTPVTADYDVDSLGMSVAAGYDLDFGLTPELGLRYMHVMADDYTNSLGVKTKSDNTNFLTGVLGAKYAFNVVADKYTTFVPQLNAGIKYDMLSDKNVATITMPGVDAYTLDVERLSRFGGEFGIGLGMKHRGMDFSINYDIDVRKDYTSQTGMLKFRYNF